MRFGAGYAMSGQWTDSLCEVELPELCFIRNKLHISDSFWIRNILELLHISCNPKTRYRLNNSPSLSPFLNQNNSFRTHRFTFNVISHICFQDMQIVPSLQLFLFCQSVKYWVYFPTYAELWWQLPPRPVLHTTRFDICWVIFFSLGVIRSSGKMAHCSKIVPNLPPWGCSWTWFSVLIICIVSN